MQRKRNGQLKLGKGNALLVRFSSGSNNSTELIHSLALKVNSNIRVLSLKRANFMKTSGGMDPKIRQEEIDRCNRRIRLLKMQLANLTREIAKPMTGK